MANYGGQSHPSVIRRQKSDQQSTSHFESSTKLITTAFFRHQK